MLDDQITPAGDEQTVTPAVEPEEASEEKTTEEAATADEVKA